MTGRLPNACHTNLHGYQLVLTSKMMPEQYDVYDRHARVVGYIRQRHGHVRAHWPDCGGACVYEADTTGTCGFDPDERLHHLWHAVLAIETVEKRNGPSGTGPPEVVPLADFLDYVVRASEKAFL